MLTLMDWMVQLESSRASLTRTGQARLAQLAYSEQKAAKQAKAQVRKQPDRVEPLPVRCCPEAAA